MPILKPHKAILWNSTGPNSFGEPVFGPPLEFMCRWQDRNQKYQSLSGDERISNSQIYYEEQDLITPGDRIARGSMNSLLLKTKTVDWFVLTAGLLGLPWIDDGSSGYSNSVYEGMLLGSLVVAMLEGSLESGDFEGSLIQLLHSDEIIDGIDYAEELEPWNAPYTRMVGAVESTSSVDGGINLFKAMTEVYAKGY